MPPPKARAKKKRRRPRGKRGAQRPERKLAQARKSAAAAPERARPAEGTATDATEGATPWHRLWAALWWLLVPLGVAVAFRTVTEFEFVGDARFLILENRYIRELGLAWDHLTHNFFWSSAGNAVPYWRPLTKISWLVEYHLFGPRVAGFMMVQVGWHVVGVLGVQQLARWLGARRRWAMLAGAIYGLHPVAIAPVCMLMARSDVVASCATIWAVATWLRWHTGHGRRWLAAHLLAVVLALGSKEVAVIIPVLLVAWTVLPRLGSSEPRPSWRRSALHLAPATVAVTTTLVLRSVLLRREAVGLQAVEVDVDALRLSACLAKYLQNLWPFAITSGVRDIPITEARSGAFWVVAMLTLVATAAIVAWAIRRRDGVTLALLAWVLLALGPVLITGNIHVPAVTGKYPLADRWLVHTLAPAALIWARLAQATERWLTASKRPALRLRGRSLRLPAGRSVVAGIAMAIAVWAALVLHNSRGAAAEFGTEAGLLDNEDRAYYYATPEAHRTAEDHCRFHERKIVRALKRGDLEAAARQTQEVVARCGSSPERDYWLFSSLVRAGRYPEAEPLARRLLANPPRDRRSHATLTKLCGIVFLHTGHPAEAEQWLLKSQSLGALGCDSLIHLAEAARGLGRPVVAADRLAAAFECGGQRDPSLLLAAATLLLEGGQRQRCRQLVDQARRLDLSPDQRHQAAALDSALAGESSAPLTPVPRTPR